MGLFIKKRDNVPTLAESGGIIYCGTNIGALAALNSDTGEVLWLTNYLAEVPKKQLSGLFQAHSYSGGGMNPPILHEGILYYLPQDVNYFFAFDPETGKVLWKKEVKYMRDFLGIIDGIALFGGYSLIGIDINTQKQVWEVPMDSLLVGKGFLSNKIIYLPLKKGLYRFDVRTKKLLNEPAYPWSKGGGGNVVMSRGLILAPSLRHLNTFLEKGEGLKNR